MKPLLIQYLTLQMHLLLQVHNMFHILDIILQKAMLLAVQAQVGPLLLAEQVGDKIQIILKVVIITFFHLIFHQLGIMNFVLP